jgi:hypothetical protein
LSSGAESLGDDLLHSYAAIISTYEQNAVARCCGWLQSSGGETNTYIAGLAKLCGTVRFAPGNRAWNKKPAGWFSILPEAIKSARGQFGSVARSDTRSLTCVHSLPACCDSTKTSSRLRLDESKALEGVEEFNCSNSHCFGLHNENAARKSGAETNNLSIVDDLNRTSEDRTGSWKAGQNEDRVRRVRVIGAKRKRSCEMMRRDVCLEGWRVRLIRIVGAISG